MRAERRRSDCLPSLIEWPKFLLIIHVPLWDTPVWPLYFSLNFEFAPRVQNIVLPPGPAKHTPWTLRIQIVYIYIYIYMHTYIILYTVVVRSYIYIYISIKSINIDRSQPVGDCCKNRSTNTALLQRQLRDIAARSCRNRSTREAVLEWEMWNIAARSYRSWSLCQREKELQDCRIYRKL